MMTRIVSVATGMLLSASLSYGQLPNDDCFGAQSLGTLPAPAACPSGAGTPQVFNLSNIGAVAENPYSTIVGCQSGANMATPASDVWFSFVASGPELDVTIGGGLIDPNIGLYEGTCGGLVPRGCNTGTTTALFTPLTPGTTYYLQISGQDELDEANFTLTLNNWQNCAQCITNASLSVTPPPINGNYQNGTQVTFCFTIDGYNQQTTNWLSAVVPTFGPGWDMTTLTPGAPPAAIGGAGTWIWTNNVTSTATGLTVPDWGWYFDLDNDGNPGNNFGDSQYNNHPTGGDGLLAGPWQDFCWTITVADCPPGQTGDDLSVNINTLADGEIGSWQSLGCAADPEYQFAAQLVCCPDPIMAMAEPLCNGGSDGMVSADGQGTGPWDYVWDDGTGTIQTSNGVAGPDTVFNLPIGTYNVTVTDTWTGCINTGTITVTEPAPITLNINSIDANCGAADGSVTATGNGGTPNYTFEWFSDAALTIPIGQTLPTASNLAAGTYYVEITDANGCVATDQGTVNTTTGAVINTIATVDVACAGVCDGEITITATGAVDYSIDGGITWVQNNVFTNLCAGNYSIVVQDAGGCIDDSSAVINTPPPIVITADGDTTICIGGSATLTASGAPVGAVYIWDNGLPNGPTHTVSPAQVTVYNVYAEDAAGCQSNTVPLVVDLNPPLSVIALSDQDICIGESASISAIAQGGDGGPYSYDWSDGGTWTGQGSLQNVSPTQTTVYTVIADDNCETPPATAQVTITVNPLPTVDFSADNNGGCAPVTVNFTNLTPPNMVGNNCIWDFGDGTASTDCGVTTHTYTEPGCYDVSLTVTSPDGCTASIMYPDMVCVSGYPTAEFAFGPQPTTYLESTIDFTNLSQNANFYDWTFDTLGTSSDEHPSFTFPDYTDGTYEVCLIATNLDNCTDTACQTVVIDGEFFIYVPNTFTPDGDGINDYFYPQGYGFDNEDYTLYIFDRWGELIFESHHIDNYWDGRMKGSMVKTDVYVWKIVARSNYSGDKHEYVGHVNVLR